MAKEKNLGFETPISELPENVSVAEIKDDPAKSITDYFVKVPCVFKKVVRKGVVYGYSLTANIHPLVTLTFDNRKLVNETQFALMILQQNLKINVEEIKFNGYLRFLKGESENSKSDDHTFVIAELFMGSQLNTVSTFLPNNVKLLMERLLNKSDAELKEMESTPIVNIPLFKLGTNESSEVLNDLEVEVA